MREQDRENDLAEMMPRILSRENMFAALAAVQRNAGAAGINEMTVEKLPTWLKANWKQTKADLLAGRYRPQAVRRVDIPKPGGGTRMKELLKLGVDQERARAGSFNGRGPWWNAGASHMNAALPTKWFRRRELVFMLEVIQRYQRQTNS